MITYFLSHPIQYFSPYFEELSRSVPLRVCYFSDVSIRGSRDKGFGREVKWDLPLLQGYQYVFLKNLSRSAAMDNRFWNAVNPAVVRYAGSSDTKVVVVHGWDYFSNLAAIFIGRIMGKQVWIRVETPYNQEVQRTGILHRAKRFFLGSILFRFWIDRFMYIGSENLKFYAWMGVSESKCIYTPYSVDNRRFRQTYERMVPDRASLRRKHGYGPDDVIVLFSGKYIDKKRPMDLIKAVGLLANPNLKLIMVGEGELRGRMEQYIQSENMANVRLTGFVNQTEIGEYYTIADLFVMCSGMGETWGLSVNEAMNFSLPLIVSRTCGCSYDLVKEGVNGHTFSEGNVEELSAIIGSMTQDRGALRAMGAASAKIVEGFSIGVSVASVKAAYSRL